MHRSVARQNKTHTFYLSGRLEDNRFLYSANIDHYSIHIASLLRKKTTFAVLCPSFHCGATVNEYLEVMLYYRALHPLRDACGRQYKIVKNYNQL